MSVTSSGTGDPGSPVPSGGQSPLGQDVKGGGRIVEPSPDAFSRIKTLGSSLKQAAIFGGDHLAGRIGSFVEAESNKTGSSWNRWSSVNQLKRLRKDVDDLKVKLDATNDADIGKINKLSDQIIRKWKDAERKMQKQPSKSATVETGPEVRENPPTTASTAGEKPVTEDPLTQLKVASQALKTQIESTRNQINELRSAMKIFDAVGPQYEEHIALKKQADFLSMQVQVLEQRLKGESPSFLLKRLAPKRDEQDTPTTYKRITDELATMQAKFTADVEVFMHSRLRDNTIDQYALGEIEKEVREENDKIEVAMGDLFRAVKRARGDNNKLKEIFIKEIDKKNLPTEIKTFLIAMAGQEGFITKIKQRTPSEMAEDVMRLLVVVKKAGINNPQSWDAAFENKPHVQGLFKMAKEIQGETFAKAVNALPHAGTTAIGQEAKRRAAKMPRNEKITMALKHAFAISKKDAEKPGYKVLLESAKKLGAKETYTDTLELIKILRGLVQQGSLKIPDDKTKFAGIESELREADPLKDMELPEWVANAVKEYARAALAAFDERALSRPPSELTIDKRNTLESVMSKPVTGSDFLEIMQLSKAIK